MRKKLLWFALFATLSAWFGKDGQAQPAQTARHIFYGGTLPATCNQLSGDVFIKNNVNPTLFYQCTALNTWTLVGTGAGGPPTGAAGGNLNGNYPNPGVKGIQSGTIGGIPATCTIGDLYFSTSAPAGANIYQCDATNVWTAPVTGASPAGSAGCVQLYATSTMLGCNTDAKHFVSTSAPGSFTLSQSGIVMQDAMGNEIWRLWGTDTDEDNDFNSHNLYFGWHAGLSQPTDNMTAGYDNVGVGALALEHVTTGTGNTGIGNRALEALTTADENAALGDVACELLTTGVQNSCIGSNALGSLTTGRNNVAVGYTAGNHIVTGSDNTFLGRFATTDDPGDYTNALGIGSGVVVTASNTGVIGNVSVTDIYFGSITAATKLHALDFISTGVAFAALGTPANGTIIYCSDCTNTSNLVAANTCANMGSGAIAVRINGAWKCFN